MFFVTMYLIVHGEGLAKADNQHGRVLLVHRGVVQVDVVHQLDRLRVVHGRPAHDGDGDDDDGDGDDYGNGDGDGGDDDGEWYKSSDHTLER